jgi:hypothetical protein
MFSFAISSRTFRGENYIAFSKLLELDLFFFLMCHCMKPGLKAGTEWLRFIWMTLIPQHRQQAA